ncbi:MAG: HEAT repeat domain-containing protein [Cyanobacteria bacterium Co-bin13]|nr:HEAT repeat domain-containing protein [Cyanobacteria bacterium Co-bin13]
MVASPYLKFLARASAASVGSISAFILLSSPAIAQGAVCPLSPSESTVDLENISSAADLTACGVEAVPTLLAALRHPDWQQRAVAAYLLGQLGPEAASTVPALVGGVDSLGVLQDDHPTVRFAAVKALGQIGSVAAVDALVNTLNDSDESVRARTILALIQMGVDARSGFPQLFEVLDRRGIVYNFSPNDSGSSVEFQVAGLKTVLEDGNWSIRNYAAEALVQLGKDQADILPKLSVNNSYPSGLFKGLSHVIFQRIGPPTLIEALQSPNTDTRRTAAQKLGELGVTAAVPHLLILLDDPDESVRIAGIEALGQVGAATALPALIEQMEAGSTDIREATAIALGRINSTASSPEGVAALTAALPTDIGYSAAQSLGRLGLEAAVPALAEIVQESNINLCRPAALALGQIGSPAAVSVLTEAIQQEDWVLRSCALRALGQIPLAESSEALTQARRESIPLLIEALQQTWEQNPGSTYRGNVFSIEIRMAAASALALVDTDVIPALIEAVPSEIGVPIFVEILQNTSAMGTPLPRATYRDYRVYIGPADDRLVAIANAYLRAAGPALAPTVTAALNPDWDLEDLGPAVLLAAYVADEATLAALVNLLDHRDSEVRRSAAAALGQWQVASSVPVVIPLLQDPDWRTAAQAAQTLGQLGSEAALPALMEALHHRDFRVRVDAAAALGQLGSEAALPALVQALQDEDWEVRRNAVTALGQIGTAASVPLLITALEDSHFYVSYAATEALGHTGSNAVPALLTVLAQEPLPLGVQTALQDYRVQRRRAAAFALVRMGGHLSSASKAAVLEGLQELAFDPQEHSEVRRMAATALAQFGVSIPSGNPVMSPQLLNCEGVDPDIHLYAGQCVYEDVFQGGDGLYEIYESLRKLLRRR